MLQLYDQLERYREEKGRVRIAKYSRCSSDEQKKNGYTVKDQLDFIEVFAKENELVVVGEYVDEGISATLEISKRKALAQLITDAKAGKFDIVVFKCIDRFFRSVGEYYECQKQLEKAGVTWLSIEEADLDPQDDDAAFKINIYLTMAEYEARKTSKRIRFNNRMRVKNKQVVTGTQNFLFPWKVVGEKRNRHLERNMEQADRVYDLLDHFETFQSKGATVKYNNSKYEPVSYKVITKFLSDALLYGEYKGVPDYVEPYITKERFDHIQGILKRNARHSPDTGKVFLYSGLIKCPHCGRNLVGNYYLRKGMKTPIHSYRCNYYRQSKLCVNNMALNEQKIETQLLNNLDQYIAIEIVKVTSIKEKKTPEIDNSQKIAAIKKEMNRLNTMFRKGRISEEEYDKDYAELEAELKKLEAVETPEERDLTALVKLMESDYRTIYEALDRPHRKAFWRNIIKEFTVGEDRQVIPESIIFF